MSNSPYFRPNSSESRNSSQTLTTNYVEVLDSLSPNKSVALSYLDGKGPVPLRYAQFVAYFPTKDHPYTEKFSVGPLPLSDRTTVQSMGYLSTRGDNGRIYDPNPNAAEAGTNYTLEMVKSSMKDILLDLIGPVSE
jgi:primary-amine oxidase